MLLDSVQAVLESAGGAVRAAVKSAMLGRLQQMSRSKFGSNVVEKCLRQSSPAWRAAFIRELCSQPLVAELLKDRFGNYVLQTALGVANAQQVGEIVRAVTPYLASLRDNVRSKWKTMLNKTGAAVSKGGQAGDDRDHRAESLSPAPRHATKDDEADDDGAAGDGVGMGGNGGGARYGGGSGSE